MIMKVRKVTKIVRDKCSPRSTLVTDAAGKEQTSLVKDTDSGVPLPGFYSSPTILWLGDLGQVHLSELELPSLFIRTIIIMSHKGIMRVK